MCWPGPLKAWYRIEWRRKGLEPRNAPSRPPLPSCEPPSGRCCWPTMESCIPEGHPWSLSDMNSPAGQAAYALADAVFAIGCRFGQTDIRWPWFTPPPRLIQLDADPDEIARLYPVEVGLVGDARTVLRQI